MASNSVDKNDTHISDPTERTNLDLEFLRNDEPLLFDFLVACANDELIQEGPFHPSWFVNEDRPGGSWYRKNIEGDIKESTIDDLDVNAILSRAAYRGRPDIADFCIRHGATFDYRDGSGRLPLHYAAFAGLPDMTEYILTKSVRQPASLRKDTMSHFLDGSNVAELGMQSEGADNSTSSDIQKDSDGTIPYGINLRDLRDWTPLLIAVCKDFVETAEVLLKFGADITLPYSHNSSPVRGCPTHSSVIHFAAMRCNMEMISLLRSFGADVEKPDAAGICPLHYCVARDRLEAATALASIAPQSIHAADHNGRTPLHVAAVRGATEIVRLLADMGADLCKKDIWDLTPLLLAKSAGHAETESLMRELLTAKSLAPAVPNFDERIAPLELDSVQRALLDVLYTGLQEADRDQLARCIKALGNEKCLTLYNTTLHIRIKGGQPVKDGSRLKALGGVFLSLVQEEVRSGVIPKESWTYIKANVREKQLANRTRRATAATVSQQSPHNGKAIEKPLATELTQNFHPPTGALPQRKDDKGVGTHERRSMHPKMAVQPRAFGRGQQPATQIPSKNPLMARSPVLRPIPVSTAIDAATSESLKASSFMSATVVAQQKTRIMRPEVRATALPTHARPLHEALRYEKPAMSRAPFLTKDSTFNSPLRRGTSPKSSSACGSAVPMEHRHGASRNPQELLGARQHDAEERRIFADDLKDKPAGALQSLQPATDNAVAGLDQVMEKSKPDGEETVHVPMKSGGEKMGESSDGEPTQKILDNGCAKKKSTEEFLEIDSDAGLESEARSSNGPRRAKARELPVEVDGAKGVDN